MCRADSRFMDLWLTCFENHKSPDELIQVYDSHSELFTIFYINCTHAWFLAAENISSKLC